MDPGNKKSPEITVFCEYKHDHVTRMDKENSVEVFCIIYLNNCVYDLGSVTLQCFFTETISYQYEFNVHVHIVYI